jgi:hypothetical protein
MEEEKKAKQGEDPKVAGKPCGAKIKVTYGNIRDDQQTNVCLAVFDYLEKARTETEFEKRRRYFTSSCIEAARECGPNRKKIDRETCDDLLKDIKDKIAAKKKKKEEIELRIASMIQACPTCAQGGGNGGAIAVGLAQALAPVGIAAIGSAMYYKMLNKSAGIWEAYYKQCVIIGVPCNSPAGFGGGGMMGGFGPFSGGGILSGMSPGMMPGMMNGMMNSFSPGMMNGMMNSFSPGMMNGICN